MAYFNVLDSVAIRLDQERGGGVEGNTVGELADFLPLPQQCEKQRTEPKLFAKVGQPRKDRRGREEAQLWRSRPLCICNM